MVGCVVVGTVVGIVDEVDIVVEDIAGMLVVVVVIVVAGKLVGIVAGGIVDILVGGGTGLPDFDNSFGNIELVVVGIVGIAVADIVDIVVVAGIVGIVPGSLGIVVVPAVVDVAVVGVGVAYVWGCKVVVLVCHHVCCILV